MYGMEGALHGLPCHGDQLPGPPGSACRPPGPCTRTRFRFPGASRVPGVSPRAGARFRRWSISTPPPTRGARGRKRFI